MLITLHMCKYSFMDVYRCVRIVYVILLTFIDSIGIILLKRQAAYS